MGEELGDDSDVSRDWCHSGQNWLSEHLATSREIVHVIYEWEKKWAGNGNRTHFRDFVKLRDFSAKFLQSAH